MREGPGKQYPGPFSQQEEFINMNIEHRSNQEGRSQ